jgi:hypothetical protein
MHALECVEKAQGKRGGGLTEYARLLGRDKSDITRYRHAAEVYSTLVETFQQVGELIDKPNHLVQLHAAPSETWSLLAEAEVYAQLVKSTLQVNL